MKWMRSKAAAFMKYQSPVWIAKAHLIILTLLLSLGGLTFSLSTSQPVEAIAATPADLSEPDAVHLPSAAGLPQGFVQGRKPLQVAEVELITLTPDGFFPSAITRSGGQFVIAYDNRSGSGDLNIQLTARANRLVHRLPMPLLKHPWLGEFNLSPGKYLISESTHPDWRCELTIN